MADDDRAVMERLAALEAEVKADADAQRERKAAALTKLRDQRVTQTAAQAELRTRQAELVGKKRSPAAQRASQPAEDPADELDEQLDRNDRLTRDRASHLEDLGGALELASKANRVKQELARKPKQGEKSWIASGLASLALGPLGWLYAGSLREAVPATVGWLALGTLAAKLLPAFLIMPALMVILPLSGIAGVVYALQYNRKGSRQRLFDSDKPQKQLGSG